MSFTKYDKKLLITEFVRQYNILACPKKGVPRLKLREQLRGIK